MLPEQTFQAAPFGAMVDSLDPPTADPYNATLLQNCFVVPGPPLSAVLGRPGFKQLGLQLGSGGNRTVQGFHQFTKTDGTEITVAFVGGKMYTLNWATRVWTDFGSLAPATLSTSARVRCVTFAGVMVVTDGVNTPWTWDGSGAPVVLSAFGTAAFGPPTVYYGKLFFIRADNRIRMEWSEENLPNTGYAGVNNVWDVYQTGTAPLFRLLGTNEALYYWRARSCGRITGAVTPDFVASGTREGVSDTIGTVSPDAVAIYDDVIYFPSADGQPYKLYTSGSLLPLWPSLRETYRGWNKTDLPVAWSVAYPPVGGVIMGVSTGGALMTQYPVLSQLEGHEVLGLWSGWLSSAIGVVKDNLGNVVLMHGQVNGYVYDHGNPDGFYWQDENNSAEGGTQAIAHGVVGSALGYSVKTPKQWHRVDVVFRLLTDLTNISFDYETPHGVRPAPALLQSIAAGGALWDVALWDVASWATDAIEYKISYGLTGAGRWMRPRIRHQFGVEQFAILGLSGVAFLDAAMAEVR